MPRMATAAAKPQVTAPRSASCRATTERCWQVMLAGARVITLLSPRVRPSSSSCSAVMACCSRFASVSRIRLLTLDGQSISARPAKGFGIQGRGGQRGASAPDQHANQCGEGRSLHHAA